VVEAGENLATISTRYYGTPSRWKNIFNANQGRLTDANNVRVGTRLNIPELE
jgi:nucleoid-associated protein YgaU